MQPLCKTFMRANCSQFATSFLLTLQDHLFTASSAATDAASPSELLRAPFVGPLGLSGAELRSHRYFRSMHCKHC